MILREKSSLWKLTGPFASRNYSTFDGVIYYPKGRPPSEAIIAHEAIHYRQQLEVGKWKYLFLYLFCLPLFWNPWRFEWELEAYTKGSGITPERAREILSGVAYGWLQHQTKGKS